MCMCADVCALASVHWVGVCGKRRTRGHKICQCSVLNEREKNASLAEDRNVFVGRKKHCIHTCIPLS